jgi:hypothetical protein
MVSHSEDRLLTYEEVSEKAKVSIETVKYWRQTGQLRVVKVGKHPRVWLSDFNKAYGKPCIMTPLETLGGEDGKA